MILTTLPDLPPLPETNANAEFRRRFYSRWGKENAVICGQSTCSEYATMTQTLSIKMAWRGRERYRLRHREVSVDDESYLILNEGSSYGSVDATLEINGRTIRLSEKEIAATAARTRDLMSVSRCPAALYTRSKREMSDGRRRRLLARSTAAKADRRSVFRLVKGHELAALLGKVDVALQSP